MDSDTLLTSTRGHGQAAAPEGAAVTRYSPWVYRALSLATVLWLLVQGVAGVIQSDHAYPVTAYAMFSQPSDGTFIGFGLQGTHADGTTEPVTGEEFGLTELQLRGYLVRNIGEESATAHPRARERLATLARIWEERQGERLDGLVMWRSEQHLDDDEPRFEAVASWER